MKLHFVFICVILFKFVWWETYKKKGNQGGAIHLFTPLYIEKAQKKVLVWIAELGKLYKVVCTGAPFTNRAGFSVIKARHETRQTYKQAATKGGLVEYLKRGNAAVVICQRSLSKYQAESLHWKRC